MKLLKVAQFGNVPAGTNIWLNEEQARSRMHVLTEVDGKKSKDRKLYTANAQIGFKAGEELAIEGDLDRGLEVMFAAGDADTNEGAADDKADKPSKTALRKSFVEGEEAGAAKLLAALEKALGLDPIPLAERQKGKESAAQSVLDEALAKAGTEGRRAMLAEVDVHNAAYTALEDAQDALAGLAQDADKTAATEAVAKAQADVDALKPLVA